MSPTIIPRNHSTSVPQAIVIVDCETLPGPHPNDKASRLHLFRLGCATALRLENGKVTRRKTLDFTDPEEFWQWLCEVSHVGRPTWLIAHKISFDLTVLDFWKQLNGTEWRISDADVPALAKRKRKNGKKLWNGFIVDEDPPVILSAKHRHGWRLLAVDTLNYWRKSLKQLGESIGKPKFSMPQFSEPDASWFDYCRNDVDILETAFVELLQWWKEQDLGMFRYTTPSLSFAAWRHSFRDKVIVRHDEDDVRKLERSAYYGGRLELLYRGDVKEDLFELDVNSIYPAILHDELFPVELTDHWQEDGGRAPESHQIAGFAAADVLIDTKEPLYPYRVKEGLIFPTGTFWTSLCGPELQKAKDMGAIITVGRWANYRLGRPFVRFVKHFWDERIRYRNEGNDVYADFCKDILTGFYGKWAQMNGEWIDAPLAHEVQPWRRWRNINAQTGERIDYRTFGYHVQKRGERKDHKWACPIISGFTTSYARQLIRKLTRIAGNENVYYIVTDALFVNREGMLALQDAGWIDRDALGKLKVKTYGPGGTFTALHNYSVGSKSVPARNKSTQVALDDGSDGYLEFENLRAITSRVPLPGVKVTPKPVQLNCDYWRGTLKPDGRVVPLKIDASHDDFRIKLEKRILTSIRETPCS